MYLYLNWLIIIIIILFIQTPGIMFFISTYVMLYILLIMSLLIIFVQRAVLNKEYEEDHRSHKLLSSEHLKNVQAQQNFLLRSACIFLAYMCQNI